LGLAFGRRDSVDLGRHLIGSAGKGDVLDYRAFYLNSEPGLTFGERELTMGDAGAPNTCARPAEIRDSVVTRRLGVNREEVSDDGAGGRGI
jgi:hypothetical protein